MKSFQKFLNQCSLQEGLTYGSLNESSLSRIYRYVQGDTAFGTLSAFRANKSHGENMERSTTLARQIRLAGYGFIEIDGASSETIDGQRIETAEFSFFIPAIVGGVVETDDRLRGFVMGWMKAFEQDAVIYKPYGKEGIQLIKNDGTIAATFSQFSVDAVSAYFSRLHNKPSHQWTFK